MHPNVAAGEGIVKSIKSTAKMLVIMLTTTDDPREIAQCYEPGCNVYVTKPVEYKDFVEAVKRLGLFLQIVQISRGERCMGQLRDPGSRRLRRLANWRTGF